MSQDHLSTATIAQTVDAIIINRKTAKILRNPDDCQPLSDAQHATMRQYLEAIIAVAGWAPFHKLANEAAHRQGDMPSIVPWRFYVLEKPACCQVLQFIQQKAAQYPDSKWSRANASKVPMLLSGASALINVTWLPDPPTQPDATQPEFTVDNMEHLAAASAAVQNLMLAAEARGLYTYWASGGILKDSEMFDYLGMPTNQWLLGAIYLALPDAPHDQNVAGKLRDQRGEVQDWARFVMLP